MHLTVVVARARCAEFLTRRHILSLKRGNDQIIAHIARGAQGIGNGLYPESDFENTSKQTTGTKQSLTITIPRHKCLVAAHLPIERRVCISRLNLEKETVMSSTSYELQSLELLPGDLLRPFALLKSSSASSTRTFPLNACGIHSALLPERSRGYASAAQFVDRGSFDSGRSLLEPTEHGRHAARSPDSFPPDAPPSVHAAKASPFF